MSKTAYIDFDGTIIDVIPRYYGVLAKYLNDQASLHLDFDKYYFLKQQGLKDHIIVQKSCNGYNINIEHYVAFKKSNMEDERWLIKDTIIGSPYKAYYQLHTIGFKVCVLTQRNYKERLIDQIYSLKLENAFDDIIVVKPITNKNVKLLFLKNKIGKKDIIVGDSPAEMECAYLLNIDGYFVETGLWAKNYVRHKTHAFVNYNAVADFLTF